MKPTDWTYVFNKYPGMWVVFKEDHKTVVSASKTVEKAVKEAKNRGVKTPFLFKVPKESLPYVGGFSSIE